MLNYFKMKINIPEIVKNNQINKLDKNKIFSIK